MARNLWLPGAVIGSFALLAVVPTAVAAAPLVVLQAGGGFCAMPFFGDLATWGTPKATKLLMFAGAGTVLYGLFGAPAEGRGWLSLRMALGLGLVMFFVGFQWAPTWQYVGGIFGNGQVNAVTCGM